MRKRPSSNALNSFFFSKRLLIFLFFVFCLLFANYFSYRNVLIGQKNMASTSRPISMQSIRPRWSTARPTKKTGGTKEKKELCLTHSTAKLSKKCSFHHRDYNSAPLASPNPVISQDVQGQNTSCTLGCVSSACKYNMLTKRCSLEAGKRGTFCRIWAPNLEVDARLGLICLLVILAYGALMHHGISVCFDWK